MRAFRWISGILAGVVVLVLVGVVAFAFGGASAVLQDGGEDVVETSTKEIITAVEQEEQVVLLSTHVQGIYRTEASREQWGRRIPLTKRTNLLQYTYAAKLGIEGGDVRIEETGTDSYLVTVPAFLVIGYSDPQFETVLDDGELLSIATGEIDSARIISGLLNSEENKRSYIDQHRGQLEDQARSFYTGIIHAIDEDVTLTFEFAD